MKIYFLALDIYGMGGTVRTVLNVANYLAEHGYDVEIVSVIQTRETSFFDIHPRVNVRSLRKYVSPSTGAAPSRAKRFRKLFPSLFARLFQALINYELYRFLKGLHSGILITTRPNLNVLVAKYAGKGVRVVAQEHIFFDAHPEELQKSIKKYYSRLDYLVTLTDADRDEYKRLFAKTNLDVRKIPNAVSPLELKPSVSREQVVIAAGRLVPEKGFDKLIQSFQTVARQHPDWKLKIFGHGPEQQALETLIQDCQLSSHVFLMGSTQDIAGELASASIYALSSRHEGFGMVILEAMQCGVPVVSFDCPKGPREIIHHNVDGVLVENGNVQTFSKALMDLISNPGKRQALADQALDNVEQYHMENVGQQWKAFLREISTEIKQ